MRDEYVNIGVLLEEVEAVNPQVLLRITNNWTRVLRLDPYADIAVLGKIEGHFRHGVEKPNDTGEDVIEQCRALLSNSVQITNPLEMTSVKGLITKDLNSEIDRLMEIYVEDGPANLRIEADSGEPISG